MLFMVYAICAVQGYVLTRLPSFAISTVFKLMNTDDSTDEKKSK